MRKIEKIMFGLIVLQIISSIYLIYSECTAINGCDYVQNSSFGEILGIKVSFIGLFAFSALLIVYLMSYKKIISKRIFFLAVFIGTSSALYFIYIQLFILNSICKNCMVIDLTMIVIAIVSFYEYMK
jgi:uncharacterized membrane protein